MVRSDSVMPSCAVIRLTLARLLPQPLKLRYWPAASGVYQLALSRPRQLKVGPKVSLSAVWLNTSSSTWAFGMRAALSVGSGKAFGMQGIDGKVHAAATLHCHATGAQRPCLPGLMPRAQV